MEFARVLEFQGQYPARADGIAFVGIGFVDHAEAIAFAQVTGEVHPAAENLRHLHGDVVWHASSIGSAEQGILDDAFGQLRMSADGLAVFRSLEAIARGADVQPARQDASGLAVGGGVVIAQPGQVAFCIVGGLYGATRIQFIDSARRGVSGQKGQQALFFYVQALQNGGQRIAGFDPGLFNIERVVFCGFGNGQELKRQLDGGFGLAGQGAGIGLQ